MFSTQHAQSDNFINPKHYVKNRDACKRFMIDARNQFQPLENEIEGQSNNNELNMAQQTINNSRSDRTMTAEKSNENNFVLSDVDNCISNNRRPEKKEC